MSAFAGKGYIGVGAGGADPLTPDASTRYITYAQSESLNDNSQRVEVMNIFGANTKPYNIKGITDASGQIAAPMYPGMFDSSLLYSLHGGASATGWDEISSLANLYQEFVRIGHSGNAPGDVAYYSTLEVFRDVTTSIKFHGAKISQMGIAFAPNNVNMLNYNIMAFGTEFASATPQNSIVDPETLGAGGGTVVNACHFDKTQIFVGSVTNLIESLDITVNMNMELIYGLKTTNHRKASSISHNNAIDVSFSGTMEFANYEEYNKFLLDTEFRIYASCRSAISNSYGWFITVPRCRYTNFSAPMQGRGRVLANFQGEGLYDQTSDGAIYLHHSFRTINV